jgi:uncharacterized protein YlxP (DUF503 family)
MFYGVARLEFIVPHSRSLKEKRSVLNRLKDRISSRYGVAVAEVDFQDLWQRAAVGIALVAQGAASARNGLAAVRRTVEAEPRVEILEFRVRIARFGEEGASAEEDA